MESASYRSGSYRPGSHRFAAGAAAVLTAALACLQPGIDPVFLTLLSAAHGVNPADHGWIVGATQAGMAAGSLLLWRLGTGLHRAAMPLAALGALLAGLATVMLTDAYALLAVRALFGFAMGIVYTQAMSRAAAFRPMGAYGAVFLVQLILSTAVALSLPAVAGTAGAAAALAVLVLVPLMVLALTALPATARDRQWTLPAAEPGVAGARDDVPASGWVLAAATFFFICATMMIWSFTGALATAAGIGEESIGLAVAVGSIAGALTAMLVMREQPLIPLVVTGMLASLCLIAPLVLAPLGQVESFVLSIILLNIGSTSIIIRCSGMATVRSRAPLFRRFVACTHPLGMIAGPVIGSVMALAFGAAGLLAGAVSMLMLGCCALGFAALSDRRTTMREWVREFGERPPAFRLKES